MATNTPTTIPPHYADSEKLTDAYKRGWNHGHGIACHNVPTLGDKVWTEDLGKVAVDADNIREVHASYCFLAADNSRQFSPFEFTAHEFNNDETSREALWEAFEAGTGDAINADLATYDDADYGIEAEPEEGFSVSFEIVTQESAEQGDADERGFIEQGVSLRDAIEAVRETRTSQVDGVTSVECDSYPCYRVRHVTIANGMEFETGARESRTLHIPDNVTNASSRRIARLLGARLS